MSDVMNIEVISKVSIGQSSCSCGNQAVAQIKPPRTGRPICVECVLENVRDALTMSRDHIIINRLKK